MRQSQDGKLTLGPDSVGYRLLEQGVSFGGETLTLSDIMLQLHRERWTSDLPRPLPELDNVLCQQAYRQMIDKVESAIDRIKSSSAAIPAVLVGGGSILLPDVLSGISQVMRPLNFDAANAVGVALGKVGAQIERVVKMPDNDREKIKSELQQQTVCLAEETGAMPGSVEIIDYQEIPLAYLPGNAVQVKIKAAGNLA